MIKGTRNILYDPVLCYPEETNFYDSVEFNVPASTTNYDVDANVADAFTNVPVARFVELITNCDITVRFNLNTNHGITVLATDGKLNILPDRERLKVTNIFITNATAGTATIKLRMT